MIRRLILPLLGALVALLVATSVATAATPPLQIYAFTQRLSLGTQDVQQLVDGGARIEISPMLKQHPVDVRLFVYQRTLNRGGATGSKTPPAYKQFVSPLGNLRHPTTSDNREITLPISPQYREELLHAGPLILGIEEYGYSN